MKRPLAAGVSWDKETIAVQDLDWEHSDADFNRLFTYVKSYVRKNVVRSPAKLKALASEEELRAMTRKAAGEYKDKFGSLGFWCYQRVKFFVRRRMREREGQAPDTDREATL